MQSINYTKEQVLFPSAARTTHAASADVQCNGKRYLRFDIDITAFTGTSITFQVQFYDPGKNAYVNSTLVSAALTATGHTVLLIGPDVTTSANAAYQAVVHKRMRIVPSGTITSVTYSVSAVAQ
jgi:quinol-cytochrome oxidoreductase complex cytochrome b subunit